MIWLGLTHRLTMINSQTLLETTKQLFTRFFGVFFSNCSGRASAEADGAAHSEHADVHAGAHHGRHADDRPDLLGLPTPAYGLLQRGNLLFQRRPTRRIKKANVILVVGFVFFCVCVCVSVADDGADGDPPAVADADDVSGAVDRDQGARPLRRRVEGPAEDGDGGRQDLPAAGQAVVAGRTGGLQTAAARPRQHPAVHERREARRQPADRVLAHHRLPREGLPLRLPQGNATHPLESPPAVASKKGRSLHPHQPIETVPVDPLRRPRGTPETGGVAFEWKPTTCCCLERWLPKWEEPPSAPANRNAGSESILGGQLSMARELDFYSIDIFFQVFTPVPPALDERENENNGIFRVVMDSSISR